MPGKRMFAHDYTRVGFYMITILTAGRQRTFGVCADNRTALSEAGEIVRRRWQEIPRHRPCIETNTLVVMPDHLHGIVYVREPLSKPVGQTIRGFKSGVTSELFLLDKPDLMAVQVSRRATAEEIDASVAQVAAQTWRGTVMVSPFISPGEKAIARRVMEQEFGSLILIKPDGFPPLYKPSGAYFDLCALGRLLVLSAFPYTGRKQDLTREQCLQMNGWVEEMCVEGAVVNVRQ